jgi:putative transposase
VCRKSKDLFNKANSILKYEKRQNKKFSSAYDINKRLKDDPLFKALPSKTSQQIIIQLCQNWSSYFKAIEKWKSDKGKFLGKPQLPKYKNDKDRNIVFYDYQQGSFRNGMYKFSKTDIWIETKCNKSNFRLCRILPFNGCYKIEMVHERDIRASYLCADNTLAIDIGLNNFATLTNNIGVSPVIINGKVIKSVNNYYNKNLAEYRSYIGKGTSKRVQKLNLKRNNILDTHIHRISRWIINYCIKNNIGNIVIGNNDGWKQKFKNQQSFSFTPYEKLINQLRYKAEDEGIMFEVIDERYTSKASFIDNDLLPDKFGDYEFSGKRVKRGLYKSKNGTLINADVNGSYNILRKSNPEFNYDRIKGVSLHPSRITIA